MIGCRVVSVETFFSANGCEVAPASPSFFGAYLAVVFGLFGWGNALTILSIVPIADPLASDKLAMLLPAFKCPGWYGPSVP